MRENTAQEESNNTANRRVHPARLYKAKARSRITNGKDLLPDIDGRIRFVRRFRDLNALLLSDLGGSDQCSEAEKALIRRACCLAVECERLEMVFAQDGKASPSYLNLYIRACGTLRRILKTTGLARRAKDLTPTVADYVASIQDEEAA
jgi:hypothetical protein